MARFGIFKSFFAPLSYIIADKQTRIDKKEFYGKIFDNVCCDDSMKLVYTSIYFRHGTRTPVWVMDEFKDYEYPPFLVYQEGDPSKPSLPNRVFDVESNKEGIPDSYLEKIQKERPLKGDCVCGQLTIKGWEDSISLGKTFRARYIDEYKLLPNNYDQGKVRNYSTNMNRTIDSLKGVLFGMFGNTISDDNPAIIFTRPIEKEYNFPNSIFCNILKEYDNWVHGTEYSIPQCSNLKQKIYETINDRHNFSMRTLWDNLNSLITNNLIVPDEIITLRDELETCISIVEKKTCFGVNPKIMKCSFGKILDDILTGFDDVVSGKSNLKISFTACHDTTLLTLITAAGGFKAKWPKLGSFIAFELLQDTVKHEYYVRVIFDGEVIEGAMADDEGLVPLSVFINKQEPLRLKNSWENACLNN